MKNRNKLFIDMASLVAEQSTCCRLHVGAVLVKDERVISIGFNGVPPKQMHCEDFFKVEYESKYSEQYKTYEEFLKSKEFYEMHGRFSNENELHAEQNAILFAAKNGIAVGGSSLYITLSPCIHCAKVIITAGIQKVYYKELYDRSQEGIVFLERNGIKCIHLKDDSACQ